MAEILTYKHQNGKLSYLILSTEPHCSSCGVKSRICSTVHICNLPAIAKYGLHWTKPSLTFVSKPAHACALMHLSLLITAFNLIKLTESECFNSF